MDTTSSHREAAYAAAAKRCLVAGDDCDRCCSFCRDMIDAALGAAEHDPPTPCPIVAFPSASPSSDPEGRRIRLPNRRASALEEIEFLPPSGKLQRYTAGVSFNLATGKPKEIFLSGAKVGTEMDALIGDTATIVSVAMQYGVPAEAMAASVARVPETLDGPATKPASVAGAAVMFLAKLERGE